MLPPGKIPFVMSQDDLCYYPYMSGDGFADRIVIGEDGKPTCQMVLDDGTVTAALKGRYLLKKGFPVTVTSEGSVNTSKLGSYTINYHASFLFWKGADSKTVTVEDTVPPEIKLTTNPDHYTLPGHPYEEEGYTASDNVDGDLTDKVTHEEKDGTVIYKVSDNSGNETTVTRTIVYDDPVPPVLALYISSR